MHLEYEGGRRVELDAAGESILAASLRAGLRHYHACGGNARCSTCRVVVVSGAENLSPPTPDEARLAAAKALPPQVRLACQARVHGDVAVRRLVLDDDEAEAAYLGDARRMAAGGDGREVVIAALFCDLRDFTPFVERHLPYDVAHVLNRWFTAAGEVVLAHGGHIDKFIGDAVMALFGLDGADPAAAARAAVDVGLDLLAAAERLNGQLGDAFGERLSVGVGVHVGAAIVGKIGHPSRCDLTALGDNVNIASRVESATKQLGARLLVTAETWELAKDAFVAGRRFEAVPLKGKSAPQVLVEVVGRAETAPPRDDLAAALRRRLRVVVSRMDSPACLRLAFHWALGERFHPELVGITARLRAVRAEFRDEVGMNDVVALAGAVAVERCDGPRIEMPLGASDVAPPADPELPKGEDDFVKLRARFARAGLSVADLVVLSGCHSLGLSKGRPFTDTPFTFDNAYFARVLHGGPSPVHALLRSDRALLEDDEARALVVRYAGDLAAFRADFVAAYRRLWGAPA